MPRRCYGDIHSENGDDHVSDNDDNNLCVMTLTLIISLMWWQYPWWYNDDNQDDERDDDDDSEDEGDTDYGYSRDDGREYMMTVCVVKIRERWW